MESYKHLIAKELLATWLRQTVKRSYDMNEDWSNWAGITFRTNKDKPNYGIYTEYPMASLRGEPFSAEVLWEEREEDDNYNWKEKPPSYGELTDLGYKVHCIFDVAIAHKGGIRYVFELVHTSGVSNRKIDYCNRLGIELHIMNCDAILEQCNPLICNPDGTLLQDNTSKVELTHG